MVARVAVEGWIIAFLRSEHDEVDGIDRDVYEAEAEDAGERFAFRVVPTASRWDVRDAFLRHPKMRRRIAAGMAERSSPDRPPPADGGREEAMRARLEVVRSGPP